ncbi:MULTISPECIES: RluA family pseudouridine synthase [unclassified Breznakia]|uniref:RluA family pseudouridine synthase n=1 Tax=unclassified Breznakia TaxID=2623764 RepID=UPI0024733C26|nr:MULTISPECIES: RluA family pseudouridine synthase [unclassified Breznakia]MDH6367748.1 23S rRNA pseudouridine955/2504/2580 synthase [Breznakia sp. PH1-1]MDH6404836.1 23S rRNA pseudouridine955/2504/2580 synthase [Breznakia sp. PF1-11]MDH6412538.1 23S rRNA pseudouridine955/2504/2580 synthase [Breznakia sp. PFB1-11]MDH6414911.1 23S rRNA pseudouridine955/2504/2580 synthase [Breznakia sp. PFB1-14]MDH6417209.1 23S rRNA pseudouridine955/2504/2580 synthase [Breznakia sp. PFB1-4]
MRRLQIYENDASQRLDKFLQKTLPKLPKSLMYKYIRNKKIKVNGKRCTPEVKLHVGDTVTLYISEEFFDNPVDYSFLDAPNRLSIIYEDENILILDKPIGLLVHSDIKEDKDTLINRILHYLYDKKEYDPTQVQSFTPALAHRLDRNTQGIIMAAKNAASLRHLNSLIKQRDIDKVYVALVEGIVSNKQGELVHYHEKDMHGDVKITDTPVSSKSKQVRLTYKVMEGYKDAELVKIHLETGKSHQIRAQFAAIGHPLVGDTRYKAKSNKMPYQALAASSITFHTQNDRLFSYLDGKEFSINEIEFTKYYKNK